MKKIIVAIVGTVIIFALITGVFLTYKFVHSPEYALGRTINDVRESGLDGLIPHLTSDANEKIAKITGLADNNLISFAYDALGLEGYVNILKTKIQEMDWNVEDILKGEESAEVKISFRYGDKFSGSLSLDLLLEDEEWKIDDISNFSIDEYNF